MKIGVINICDELSRIANKLWGERVLNNAGIINGL